MSVRKRQWTTRTGQTKSAWVVAYTDGQGKRRLKTFDHKKTAVKFAATAKVEVDQGIHIPDRESATVKDAGALWIQTAEAEGLERTTVEQYRSHLRLHIEPILGAVLLNKIVPTTVSWFKKRLGEEGCSATLTRYLVRSLGSILAVAFENGLVNGNVIREMRRRRGKKNRDNQKRARGGKLRVEEDIPTPSEIRAIVHALDGSRWRPMLLTAIFTGLRASELRGLRWCDVDLKKNEVHVRQRADRYHKIGPPKTEAGERTVPLFPIVASALCEWESSCPKGDLGLVFPNGEGNVEWHGNVINRGLHPAQIAAGVSVPVLGDDGKPQVDKDGNPIVRAKYTGLHALRHFYASWCINRKADGGLELPAKVVQHRLGHSSITVTLDTYGHLFPRGDDGAELAEAERTLLG